MLQLLDRLVFLLLSVAQTAEILRKVFILFIEALNDYLLVCGLVCCILGFQSDQLAVNLALTLKGSEFEF